MRERTKALIAGSAIAPLFIWPNDLAGFYMIGAVIWAIVAALTDTGPEDFSDEDALARSRTQDECC
jgi:hypothetical protein